MTVLDALESKVFPSILWKDNPSDLSQWLSKLPRPLVFTNGCFDILHRGHVTYLAQAAALGKSLLVGVNDDASVRAQDKGSDRPLNTLDDRMAVLASLQVVNGVVPFSQTTPLELIEIVRPEVLVKGGDWTVDKIVGGTEVTGWGGTVHSIPFKFTRSTSGLIDKIRAE